MGLKMIKKILGLILLGIPLGFTCYLVIEAVGILQSIAILSISIVLTTMFSVGMNLLLGVDDGND